MAVLGIENTEEVGEPGGLGLVPRQGGFDAEVLVVAVAEVGDSDVDGGCDCDEEGQDTGDVGGDGERRVSAVVAVVHEGRGGLGDGDGQERGDSRCLVELDSVHDLTKRLKHQSHKRLGGVPVGEKYGKLR